MRFGYARVSTKEQNTARQEDALNPVCDELLIDKVSGKNADRPQLQVLLQRVRAGDEVHVKSVDRLARNTRDLLEILDGLLAKGVTVHFIDNRMEFTDNPTSRFMITMLGAVGELERSFIRQRQSEGIAIAKEAGAFKGKPKDTELRERVRELLQRGYKPDDVAKVAGCGRATVFRIKKEMAGNE
ncbi:recombinase family protein [Pantoea eucalypti]|uniref:recombinase family protein n=1 Tax=Pantoea eucalypti TaxID=470933 RepID=UPI003EE6C99B